MKTGVVTICWGEARRGSGHGYLHHDLILHGPIVVSSDCTNRTTIVYTRLCNIARSSLFSPSLRIVMAKSSSTFHSPSKRWSRGIGIPPNSSGHGPVNHGAMWNRCMAGRWLPSMKPTLPPTPIESLYVKPFTHQFLKRVSDILDDGESIKIF